MRKILTIGAYERDNFGDLLFFLVLKEIFKYDYIVPSSIIFSDMTELMGHIVYPYHTLLKEEEWDLVIVVGGEIGGVDIYSALNMSLNTKEYEVLEKSEKKVINFCYEYLTGFNKNRTAYLPNLKLYSKNKNSALLINSVGIGSLELMEGSINYKESFEIFKQAEFLSVRDNKSSGYLDSFNIKNILCPDSVHSIKKLLDDKIEEKILLHNINCEYILFQCNQYYMQDNSLDFIVKSIEQLIGKYNKKVYLFAAGIARHHDSIELYEQIIDKIDDSFKTRILIIYERNPLSLVKYIKYSQMWMGTSLHGRIVAAAYSIPRISLENKKVAQYANLWDNEFPYNISLNELINSCEIAFNVDTTKLNAIALLLEDKAYENLKNNLEVSRNGK